MGRILTPQHRQIYLWRHRTLCMGPSNSLAPRRYGAGALHVGVYAPFTIAVTGSAPRRARVAFVAPNTEHVVDFDGLVDAKLFIERDSIDYHTVAQSFPLSTVRLAVSEGEEWVQCMQGLYESMASRDEAQAALDERLRAVDRQAPALDHRIRGVLALIRREPARNFRQEELAAHAGISASRLLAVFGQQMQMPYRRYRTWHRLLVAQRALHRCDTLTHAALEAGFSDSAHFSHSFRNAYGVTPAKVFRRPERFEVESP
ncbi:MAG: AraC family transcriptional regulator [Pseudomonadota bacterium]